MTHLLLIADDLCMSAGLNRAILDLLDRGALSGAGAMMALAAVHRPDQCLLDEFGTRLGLHLQLTEGRPLTGRLRWQDPDRTPTDIFPDQARAGELDPGDVAREWEAQLDAFIEMTGRPPARIDSHQDVHMTAALRPLAQDLAARLGVGVRYLDDVPVLTGWTGTRGTAGMLAARIQRMRAQHAQDEKTLEIVTHPGLDTREIDGITDWTQRRENEYAALADLAFRWDVLLPGCRLAREFPAA